MSLSASHQQLCDDVDRREALPCTEEDTLCIRDGVRVFPYAKAESAEVPQ